MDESLRLRAQILGLQDQFKFSCDKNGNKLSLSSNTSNAAFERILSIPIIQKISNKILSDEYLNLIFYKMKSEDIFGDRKLGNITQLAPYTHSDTRKVFGEYAPWRSTLLPLNNDRTLLNSIISNNLLRQRLLFMPARARRPEPSGTSRTARMRPMPIVWEPDFWVCNLRVT